MSDSAGGGPANRRQVTGPAGARRNGGYTTAAPPGGQGDERLHGRAVPERGGLSPSRGISLQVRGRQSGKPASLPVVVADREGSRYLVSMLGSGANWVRNVRAAGGQATVVRRGRHPVRLVGVPVDQRAPILRRYLDVAPGARPHIPVSRKAPVEEFERIAAQFPVFRIDDRPEQSS